LNSKISYFIHLSGWVLIAIFVSNLFSSCGESTDVGSDLFGEGIVSVKSTDTLSIVAKTVALDSVRVYNEDNTSRSTFLIGELDDPYFGQMKASLVSEIHFGVDLVTGQLFKPGYQEGDVLDSMILVLSIDSVGNYAKPNDRFDIEVFRLTESINSLEDIYSNQDIAFDSEVVGSASGVRIRTDSVSVYFPSLGTTRSEPGQLRIPLNETISDILFNDLIDIETNTDFIEAFNGIRVEATPSTGNSIFGVNISSNSFNSRIQSFYSRGDTTLLFEYPLNDLTQNVSLGRKLTDFQRDNKSSPIASFLDNIAASDSLIFIQSMLGTTVELDLSAINLLDDNLINQGVLEMTIAQLPDNDIELFAPIETLILSTKNENGELQILAEINEGLVFNQLEIFFGGSVEESVINDMTVFQYKMNITRSLIQMANGEIPTTLFLTPLLVTERANRTILYGPGHSKFPLKLNLSLTSL